MAKIQDTTQRISTELAQKIWDIPVGGKLSFNDKIQVLYDHYKKTKLKKK